MVIRHACRLGRFDFGAAQRNAELQEWNRRRCASHDSGFAEGREEEDEYYGCEDGSDSQGWQDDQE